MFFLLLSFLISFRSSRNNFGGFKSSFVDTTKMETMPRAFDDWFALFEHNFEEETTTTTTKNSCKWNAPRNEDISYHRRVNKDFNIPVKTTTNKLIWINQGNYIEEPRTLNIHVTKYRRNTTNCILFARILFSILRSYYNFLFLRLWF